MTARRSLPFLVAGIVVILIVWNSASFLDPLLPPSGGHFLSHVAIGLGGAVIRVGALRSQSAGGSVPRRAAELGVIAGAFILAVSGVVEAQSAWIEYRSMSTLHTLSGVAGALGLFVFAGGLLALPVAAGRLPSSLFALMLLAATLDVLVVVLGVSPIG